MAVPLQDALQCIIQTSVADFDIHSPLLLQALEKLLTASQQVPKNKEAPVNAISRRSTSTAIHPASEATNIVLSDPGVSDSGVSDTPDSPKGNVPRTGLSGQ